MDRITGIFFLFPLIVIISLYRLLLFFLLMDMLRFTIGSLALSPFGFFLSFLL